VLRRGVRTVIAYGVVTVAGCQICYFNAVEHLPVGIALLLEYLGIVLVVMWLWLHGQRPRRLMIGAGVCHVSRPRTTAASANESARSAQRKRGQAIHE